MSSQTKVHGDLNPVANFDTRSYTVGSLNDVTSGVPVQPQGPKLDFFTITKDTGAFSGANVATIINTVQQLGVVYLYQYTDTSNDTLAIAVYPTAAWTTATIDTAVTAAGVAVTVADGATFGG
jgi:hypothetical protein